MAVAEEEEDGDARRDVWAGVGLSRHQCGFAWIKGDCTRLAGEEWAVMVVVGGRVVVWWCWVVSGSSSSSSSHGVGARRASRSVGWLARCLCLSGGDTDRDSLELRARQPATTRVDEGYTENMDTSRTLGSNHQTKQQPATTHQHRSATARSRSRSRSREALRHELMYTNHLAELRLCRLLPMPWALVLP